MAIKISGSTIIDDSRNIVSAATATASSFVKTGGTSSQFLMADGSVSTGSISLTDLSVGTPASASGSGSISYDNTTGTFTYTPPDLSSYLTSYTETQTLDDVLTLGASTTQDITTTGKILYSNMYSATGDLPNASTYHGMFAHVHGTGKGYFAHGGNWIQLLDTGSSINELSDVDTSTPPTTGEVLKWNGTTWSPGTDASGSGGSSTFTGLSDTPGSLGTAGQVLVVNSGATALEFVTPYGDTDVNSHLNTSSASANQVLSWNGTDFAWVAQSSGIALTDLSVTQNAAGTAALSYDNTTGVFSYTPPDLSSYLTSYTETQTLGDVLTLGNSTTLDIITTGKILYSNVYSATGDLPSASTYHGMFAHVHGTGHGYFAHGGSWIELLDVGSSIDGLSDVDTTTTAPTSGQVLKWNGSAWAPADDAQGSGGGGIALTDLSVTQNAAGTAALSYDNTTGAFTYTPPDLSSYLTSVTASDLGSISIDALSDVDTTTAAPTSGQVLKWNGSAWAPANDSEGSGGSGGIALTDLSVTTAGTASGGGSLAYDNTTGTFTFTPADTSGGGGGGATSFTGLSDTPSSMGTAGQYLAVNSGGTALEFVAAPSGGSGGTSLTVQTRNGSSGSEGNEATAISKITFNSASGFSVSEPNEGEAFISLGSAFAPWSVDGQTTLTPEGEEEVEFIAGSGITITTDNTSTPKSITFTASGGGGGGGATTLADLTDTNISSPATGAVLKWNGTQWFAGTDNTGSGGGGGGGDGSGDGSAPLGANSRLDENLQNTYAGGLLTLTNTTQINDAIDQINLILVKLAPPTPDPLSVRSLSIKNTYTAVQSGTNEVLSNQVVNTGRPLSNDVVDFYDGANGTLTFDIDGTPDGSIALSVNEDGNTNIGSDGGLTITDDSDPYANATTGSNFWEQLTARVQSTTELAAGSTYTYNLVHSITGSVSASFFVDAPNTGGALTVSGESVDTSAANVGYVSGVPTYTANTTVAVSCTVNGAVTKAYNNVKICTMTSTVTNSKNVAPVTDPGYNEGDTITISGEAVTIGNNKFSDGDFTLALKGVNSKGDTGTSTSLVVPGRVDTKSNESSRITSGSGQYPASGYGDPYDSTQSLLNNEELQLKNGKYEYPSVDYSGNALAGPNYSTASGTRYVTFLAGNANNALDGVVNINATGLNANATNATVTDGIDMYLKVEGAGTGWFNINEGPNYSAGNLTADGDRALLYSGSSASTKACAWGSVPLTGPVYVRLGLPAGSTIKITSATFT